MKTKVNDNSPIRVALLIDQLSPGATPKFIGEEFKYLKNEGYEIEVISIVEGGLDENAYQFQEFLDGIKIRYLSREFPLLNRLMFKLRPFSFLSGYHLASIFVLPRLIKKNEYDIIIAHAWESSYFGHLIWRRNKIPYIALLWDPASYLLDRIYTNSIPKILMKFLSWLSLYSDKILASDSLEVVTAAEQIAKIIRTFTSKRVTVISPGCYPVSKIPEKRGDYALAIDRWDIGNRPDILLDVLEKMNNKIKLVVAGFWWPETLRKSFMDSLEEKGLTNYVKVLGPVTEEELKKLYLNARVWVHPIEETINICAMEAASHGCPIIMFEETDLFNHKEHGFFPRNIDEYAKYLDMLTNDERLAWKMGHNAWQLMKQYTWKDHSRKFDEIIKRKLRRIDNENGS